MSQKHLWDITEVCTMLDTTSRTLRFYEEKGLIQSTTEGLSNRRHYTEQQLTQIINVLSLRKMGLSLKAISQLLANHMDLRDAVLAKRVEIYASVHSNLQELERLNGVLARIEAGQDVFPTEPEKKISVVTTELSERCAQAIVNGEHDILYEHISPRLLQYMPREVYITVRADTLLPLGEFVCFDGEEIDGEYNQIHRFRARYTKAGLLITLVIYNEKIDGLWLGYYDTAERRKV